MMFVALDIKFTIIYTSLIWNNPPFATLATILLRMFVYLGIPVTELSFYLLVFVLVGLIIFAYINAVLKTIPQYRSVDYTIYVNKT